MLLLADACAIENFASVAKYPSGQIIGQDIFSSGAIKSATDFQLYKEVAGLSGLDFGYTDNTTVYHTKDFIYHLQVNPTIPKYKRNKDWRGCATIQLLLAPEDGVIICFTSEFSEAKYALNVL